MEHEDSDDLLTDDEQGLCQKQDPNPCTNQMNIIENHDKSEIRETNMSMNLNINHMEEVIIGTEQGTTFPTRMGTSMCNALIDTGATRSCISEKYYQNLPTTKI